MAEPRASDYSRAEVVAQQIRNRIQSEKLDSGHRLGTKEDLRSRYGVAPATVNEALKLLTARRLVDVRPGPGGGVFVADQPPFVRLGHKVLSLSSDGISVSDCLVVRDALDGPIAAEAARHATDSDIVDLRTILEDVRRTASEPMEYLHHNWRLHMRIAQISPNEILKNYYLGVMEYLQSHVSDVTRDATAPSFDRGVEVHAAIVDAIAQRDVRACKVAMDRHEALTHADVD